MSKTRIIGALIVCLSLACSTTPPAAPRSENEIAAGIELLRGAFEPGQQPDSNSVILTSPGGLVVVDTGRHPEHTQRILDLAAERGQPIAAIVNTHWHLDHVAGNVAIRRQFPSAVVYSTNAIEGAMTGFLARYRSQLEQRIASNAGKEDVLKPLRAELAIIDSGRALFPDVVVSEKTNRRVGGRALELHVEHAATAGDVWIFDPRTRVVIAGDLVTLPAPFLDTACPSKWSAALDRVSAADFQLLVPGHGPAMDRAAFDTYRRSFNALLDCAASQREKQECAAGWIADAGTLIPESDRQLAKAMIDYYVDNHLRAKTEANAALCR